VIKRFGLDRNRFERSRSANSMAPAGFEAVPVKEASGTRRSSDFREGMRWSYPHVRVSELASERGWESP